MTAAPEMREPDDFEPGVEVEELGELGTPMGSPGQCLSVRPLITNPNMLFKQYRPKQVTEQDELRIARLIAWPGTLAAPAGARFVLTNAAWPTKRVTSDGRTIGVLMALAPDRFYDRIRDPYGTQRIVLTLDHLAASNEDLKSLGLKQLDPDQRLRVCTGILAFAELLERHGLVYGDWGYQNVLWSQRDQSVHFIDVDACSFGEQQWVESFGFEDPLTPSGLMVDTYTERYRCAIMAAASLTGIKEPDAALKALEALSARRPELRELERLIRENVGTSRRESRQPIAQLCGALPASVRELLVPVEAPSVPGANITGWAAADGQPEPFQVTRPQVTVLPAGSKPPAPKPTLKPATQSPKPGATAAAVFIFLTLVIILIAVVGSH